jgi:hypothetical protein
VGESKDWQNQLLGTALMAAARTAVEYVTNPDAREETAKDVRERLSEVDYGAVAKALSRAIDQFADNSKKAVNEAIDSLRANAEDAVEAAAERAQEQLGQKRRGRGRLFFGLMLGIGIAYLIFNEERRNQLMDKVSGATGSTSPSSSSNWTSSTSSYQPPAPNTAESNNGASEGQTETGAKNPEPSASESKSTEHKATSTTSKSKASVEPAATDNGTPAQENKPKETPAS